MDIGGNMEGVMHSNMRNAGGMETPQVGYHHHHHPNMQNTLMDNSQANYHSKMQNTSIDSAQSQLGSPASAYSSHHHPHPAATASSSATQENAESEDLMVYVFCSIADFVTDLASMVSQKTGKQWVPKVVAKQKKRQRHADSSNRETDRNRPKRPQTSYFLWCDHIRKKMKEKDATRSVTTKDLSEMWKSLPDNEKEPWERKSSEFKEVYCRQMAAYKEQTDMRAHQQQPINSNNANTNSQINNTMNMQAYNIPVTQQHPGNQMW